VVKKSSLKLKKELLKLKLLGKIVIVYGFKK